MLSIVKAITFLSLGRYIEGYGFGRYNLIMCIQDCKNVIVFNRDNFVYLLLLVVNYHSLIIPGSRSKFSGEAMMYESNDDWLVIWL